MEKSFRLTKEKLSELVEALSPYILPRAPSPNLRELDADKNLIVCLYYVNNTGSIWMTANTFDIHQSTAPKVILAACIAFTKHPKYLYFLKIVEKMKSKVSQF